MTILTALGHKPRVWSDAMKALRTRMWSRGNLALAVLAVSILSPSHSVQTRTLTFNTVDDVDTVSFDPSKITEAQLRQLILLSPYVISYFNEIPGRDISAAGSIQAGVPDKVFFALPLELCVAGDPVYSHCEENDIVGPYFLRNARVNLERSKRGLAWLQQLEHPKELDPVIKFLERELSHSVWIEETRLKYYSTWDDTALKKIREGVNSEQLCPDVFMKLETAGSKEKKYAIARFDWPNCLAKAPGKNQESYPIGAWKQFLDAYGITEDYKQKGPD